MKHITFAILLSGLFSCGNPDKKAYQPEGLTKLTQEQILERLDKNQVFNPTKIKFKSIDGVELSQDSIKTLFTSGNTYGDQYIDTAGVVQEMVLRPMTDEDKVLLEKMNEIIKSRR